MRGSPSAQVKCARQVQIELLESMNESRRSLSDINVGLNPGDHSFHAAFFQLDGYRSS